jgi:hypothetical protein
MTRDGKMVLVQRRIRCFMKPHVSAYKAAQEQGKPSFNPFAKKT